MVKKIALLIISAYLLLPAFVKAQVSGDLTLENDDVTFSQIPFIEKKPIRIYAKIHNTGIEENSGNVKFILKEKGEQIGTDQSISVVRQKDDDVFVDWIPTPGNHTLIVTIEPWIVENDNPTNNRTEKSIFVDYDTDGDGIGNQTDLDDDNDGVVDTKDAFPLNPNESIDTDKDGIGNFSDPDDDNDGVLDVNDTFPLNPDESVDTDKDGIGNNQDTDDDNEGLSDQEEKKIGTNPLVADSDGDSYSDKKDQFPLDKKEWEDFDNDKIGDNKDSDDDNDGLSDQDDPNDHNVGPTPRIVDQNKFIMLKEKTFFDASPSYDKDGYIKDFTWEINGKKIGKGMILAYNLEKSGIYKVGLTTIDDKGESRKVSSEIRVVNAYMISAGIITVFVLLLAIILILRYCTKQLMGKKQVTKKKR